MQNYPHDVDVILRLNWAKVSRKQMDFTSQELLQYVSSVGLEAYKTLTAALTKFYFKSIVKVRLVNLNWLNCTMLNNISRQGTKFLIILSIENDITSI